MESSFIFNSFFTFEFLKRDLIAFFYFFSKTIHNFPYIRNFSSYSLIKEDLSNKDGEISSMFGFIAAIFKGLFSILFMGLFIVADALREFLEDIGKDLFNFPEIWIFILFGFLFFLVIKLIR